ncbi:MAG: 2-hydroxyacid dehydrogenase [Candidatus Dojkabacteria bacterium]
MRLKKLLVTNITEKELSKDNWDRLSKIFHEIVFKKAEDSDLEGELKNTDAIFSKFNAIDANIISKSPNLKYIGIFATGTGHVDLELASKKDITVTNIPGYSTESVAEFTIGVILEHLRELRKARSEGAKGNYSEDNFSAKEIRGKGFGVIGLGRIGMRVAELADAFGADVSYYSKTKKETTFADYAELDQLVANNDIISLNLALTSDTRNVIDSSLLNSIKSGAILINTAPMEIIDLDALIARLKKGDITFIWDHPDEMSEENLNMLTPLKNVITYPPIGYISEEATKAKKDIFIANVESFIDGKKLNVVN